MIWLRYALLLLIVPAYLIALTRQRWSTVPLWLVSASAMTAQFFTNSVQAGFLIDGFAPSAFLWFAATAKIMIIPIAVQLAVLFKSWQSPAVARAENAPHELVATFDAGRL